MAHLRPGIEVLDAGCGVGTIAMDLAPIVAPGRVAMTAGVRTWAARPDAFAAWLYCGALGWA